MTPSTHPHLFPSNPHDTASGEVRHLLRQRRTSPSVAPGVSTMSAYEKAGETDEWYTPAYIFDALGERFDLDVASPMEGPRHVPCYNWYHRIDRSLTRRWYGFVWMNPPFGHQRQKRIWLSKFFQHGSGIALVPDRTSAPWFQEFAPKADAILWVAPKIKFERPDGTLGMSPGTGTALFAVGDRAVSALARSGLGIVTARFEGCAA